MKMKSALKLAVVVFLLSLMMSPVADARDLEKWEWYVRLTVATDTGALNYGTDLSTDPYIASRSNEYLSSVLAQSAHSSSFFSGELRYGSGGYILDQ